MSSGIVTASFASVSITRAELERLINEQQDLISKGKFVPSDPKFQPPSDWRKSVRFYIIYFVFFLRWNFSFVNLDQRMSNVDQRRVEVLLDQIAA
jgi:hypothetical protein